MILFFDLHTLESETKNDANYLVQALYYFYKGIFIPPNLYAKYKPIQKLRKGSSFLLKPDELFSDKSTDNVLKAQYIKLAGRRDFISYKTNNDRSLHLSFYPDINLQAIKTNPLITIIKNRVHFKFEDY